MELTESAKINKIMTVQHPVQVSETKINKRSCDSANHRAGSELKTYSPCQSRTGMKHEQLTTPVSSI